MINYSPSDPSGITPTNVEIRAEPAGAVMDKGEYVIQPPNQPVTLTCSATGGVTYLFYHNGKVARTWGEAEYKIVAFSATDAGSYSCRASDGGRAVSDGRARSLTMVLGEFGKALL